MTTKPLCEELNKLNADAVAAFAEAKRIRRQRDVSFHEDAELSRDGHRRIDALVMSSNIRSGFSSMAFCTASSPFLATPQTDQSPCCSSSVLKKVLKGLLSSAIRIRAMTAPIPMAVV